MVRNCPVPDCLSGDSRGNATGWFRSLAAPLGRVISSSQGLYRNKVQHKHRINTYTHQTSMSYVGFEPTIPASERAKTAHALDRSATVTGADTCTSLNSWSHTVQWWSTGQSGWNLQYTNCRLWSADNPHGTDESGVQRRFSLNVSYGRIGGLLLGLFVLDQH
jgi:hypothetical protein